MQFAQLSIVRMMMEIFFPSLFASFSSPPQKFLSSESVWWNVGFIKEAEWVGVWVVNEEIPYLACDREREIECGVIERQLGIQLNYFFSIYSKITSLACLSMWFLHANNIAIIHELIHSIHYNVGYGKLLWIKSSFVSMTCLFVM